jgi:hypothetical protein
MGVKVRLPEIEVDYSIAWIIKHASQELGITENILINTCLNEYALFRVFDAQMETKQETQP